MRIAPEKNPANFPVGAAALDAAPSEKSASATALHAGTGASAIHRRVLAKTVNVQSTLQFCPSRAAKIAVIGAVINSPASMDSVGATQVASDATRWRSMMRHRARLEELAACD